MASVNLIGRFADLAELVAAHACSEPARELFPRYRAELPPLLDPEWLEPALIALGPSSWPRSARGRTGEAMLSNRFCHPRAAGESASRPRCS
jgi:hypothetical protein